jgi:hypothetical protein
LAVSEESYNWMQSYPGDDHRLGEYLAKLGQPMNCRLDIRMTSLEELKKASVLISELNKALNHLAYEDGRDAVLRVMIARDAMQHARIGLKYMQAKKVAKFTPAKNTTRSVSWPVQVGNLDRPTKRSESSE